MNFYDGFQKVNNCIINICVCIIICRCASLQGSAGRRESDTGHKRGSPSNLQSLNKLGSADSNRSLDEWRKKVRVTSSEGEEKRRREEVDDKLERSKERKEVRTKRKIPERERGDGGMSE